MRKLLRILLSLAALLAVPGVKLRAADAAVPARVFIIPIREDIDSPLTYLVRRGVKAAIDAKADALILDMETNGGRVDVTEEIIQIIGQFKGPTVTYVNRKAFSAGAFISVATQKIYMAPESVIGAAAPIMMSPGGTGVEDMPGTVEAKMTSGIRALVRASAEKHGHNLDVIEAMIDKNKELKIGDKVLNAKGSILTLTAKEATEKYGTPPKPLLALEVVENLDKLMDELGYANAKRTYVEPTGVERLAFWINKIAPILLIVGMVCVYLEFKTPGFGLPGTVGIVAFAIYFLGGYVAGLSGMEWIAVFLVGILLLILELFVFPGTVVLGVAGAGLILTSLVMAMVDIYPGTPALPQITMPRSNLGPAVTNLAIGLGGALALAAVLARFLPRTKLYSAMVSTAASGVVSVAVQEQKQAARVGQTGVAISPLRPGGKAKFGDELLDVMTQGEMVERGQKVRIIGHSAAEAVVEVVS